MKKMRNLLEELKNAKPNEELSELYNLFHSEHHKAYERINAEAIAKEIEAAKHRKPRKIIDWNTLT